MVETLNEADTKAKFIDPLLHSIGLTKDIIHRAIPEKYKFVR